LILNIWCDVKYKIFRRILIYFCALVRLKIENLKNENKAIKFNMKHDMQDNTIKLYTVQLLSTFVLAVM